MAGVLLKNILPGRARVAPEVVLDGRLALFHERERWLAVADLHFGYEVSQRAAGRLLPLWGMASMEQRLTSLLDDYHPRQLVIAGDLVHDRASARAAAELLGRLRARADVIVLAGNHDRHVRQTIDFLPRWETAEFIFQHGDCAPNESDRTQIIGHHHPAVSLADGAGLRLKLPAFVQQNRCWILPAFSPWAGGVIWPNDGTARIWICSPRRVLQLQTPEIASA